MSMLVQKLISDSDRLAAIRVAMGYVENGTGDSVTIFQDDVTKTYHVKAGSTVCWDYTFSGVLDKLRDAMEKLIKAEVEADILDQQRKVKDDTLPKTDTSGS